MENRYGSRRDMVVTSADVQLLAVVAFGWFVMRDRVVCKDAHGLYLTEPLRIDSGLADPYRYTNRGCGFEPLRKGVIDGPHI